MEQTLYFIAGLVSGAGLLYLGIRFGYGVAYNIKEDLPLAGDNPIEQAGTWDESGDEE